ncbi:hypothetical protein CVP04_08220 [Caviibacterium pharyngocola]|uniref:Adhesin n=1 Tax=Caviibacterium pharyngocola TaxID=28159 RepID=A0A2M8RUT4_9PAST|nr:hypothetical protein CVP04_08220 [Caviibacterium pharyngocola]
MTAGTPDNNNVTDYVVDLSDDTKQTLNQVATNTNNIANNTTNIQNNADNIAKGLNIGADEGADDNVQLGETIKYVGDSNITTAVTDNQIQMKLNKDLNVNSVTANTFTAGDTVVNTNGLTINNGPSITNSGIDAGGLKITNVAEGTDPTDAVNVSQLESVVKAAATAVEAGTNVASVTSSTDATTGKTTYTVNANGTTASAGSSAVTVTAGTPDSNNVTDYVVDLSDDTKQTLNQVTTNTNNISKLQAGFNIDADNRRKGTNDVDNVKAGETVKFTSTDKNIVTTIDGKNNVDFNLADNLTIGGKDGKDGAVGVKGADGKDGVTVKSDAIVFHGIDGVKGKDGVDGKDASMTFEKGTKGLDGNDGLDGESKTRIVYEKPNGDKEEVATLNDGLVFVGNDGKTVTRKLNQTLSLLGGLDAKTVLDKNLVSSSNLGVRYKDDGSLELVMKERPEFSGVVVNGKDGQDAAITFAKDGKDGMSIVGTRGTDGKDGLTIKGADGKDGVTFTDDGRITNVTAGKDGKDAVNVDQLKVVEETANKGWNITTNGQNSSNVKPGDTVDFANKDGNIKISNDGNKVTVDLNKDIDLGKDGSVTIGDTKVNNDGVTIKDGPSMTKEGIDAGNKVITNVAPGKDGTDAVNVDQLKEAKTEVVNAATWKVNTQGQTEAGKTAEAVSNQTVTVNHGLNTKVSEVKKDDSGNYSYEIDVTGLPMEYVDASGNTLVNVGGKFYTQKEGANGEITLTPATPAKVRITSETPMQLTNVADGKIAEDSTDAINGSQLNQVINDGLTFAGDNGEFKTPLGQKVTVSGGVTDSAKLTNNNIGVVAENGKLNVKLAKSLTGLTSAEFTDTTKGTTTTVNGDGLTISAKDKKDVSLTSNGLNNGGNRITNVGEGKDGTDAVNVNQLRRTANNLANYTNKVDKNARAGIAGAVATASLPQAYMPGKSLVALGTGTYRGESSLALGASTISDNGKWIIKGNASADSRGNLSAGAAIGYQW